MQFTLQQPVSKENIQLLDQLLDFALKGGGIAAYPVVHNFLHAFKFQELIETPKEAIEDQSTKVNQVES